MFSLYPYVRIVEYARGLGCGSKSHQLMVRRPYDGQALQKALCYCTVFEFNRESGISGSHIGPNGLC